MRLGVGRRGEAASSVLAGARPAALARSRISHADPCSRCAVGAGNDPARNRYGCFLPDLTGLATAPSARLPRRIWAKVAMYATLRSSGLSRAADAASP